MYVSFTLNLVSFHSFHIDGLSLLNKDGGLNVYFPNNSFVTNSTLTHTNSPRGERQGAPRGNDHIFFFFFFFFFFFTVDTDQFMWDDVLRGWVRYAEMVSCTCAHSFC